MKTLSQGIHGLGTILSMLSDSDSYVQPQARLSDRQQAPISERISFPIQVPPRSKRNNGQQWRDALQSCATACCRVQPRDTVCSQAGAWWIMLAPCTHMKASKKNLSPRRVRARTALIANDAIAAGVWYAHLHMLGVCFSLAR